MKRLYQWFIGRARLFRSDPSGCTRRTVHTEVTVEREAMTLLVDGAVSAGDTCPLCGQKLAPAQAEQASLRLRRSLISEETLPVDRPPP
jgi:hypothetical protein